MTGLGDNIRKARLRREHSLETVAERAGVARKTLYRVERCDPAVAIGIYARVLQALCEGAKPKEIASMQAVAISTVRSHICSIRQKTQTGSIRELINRVTVLPPITPALKSSGSCARQPVPFTAARFEGHALMAAAA